ncbi:MAG: GAF domain-containing protein [Rhodoglobus sp.]
MRFGTGTLFVRVLLSGFEAFSANSWRRIPRPPRARGMARGTGPDPDRILLAGGSSAVGWGVRSHDLGLAGYLARATAAITRRGTDIEVFASAWMSVRNVRNYLSPERISRYDAIVLTLGTVQSFQLISVKRWDAEMTALLDQIAAGGGTSPAIVVVGAEEVASVPLPRLIAARATARAKEFNLRSRQIVEGRPRVAYVDSGLVATQNLFDADKVELYSRCALAITPTLADLLEHPPTLAPHPVNEVARAAAVHYLQSRAPEVDRISQLLFALKNTFDVRSVDLFFVDSDTVTLLATTTGTGVSRPRTDALSSSTLEFRGGLVVPDLAADPRHNTRPEVVGPPHLRFYAGVPVESPDGHRVAVLGVVDTRPREFGAEEMALLRSMASRIADLLFENYRP